jgi:hypothetical protein
MAFSAIMRYGGVGKFGGHSFSARSENPKEMESRAALLEVYQKINDRFPDSYSPVYATEDYATVKISGVEQDAKKWQKNALYTVEFKVKSRRYADKAKTFIEAHAIKVDFLEPPPEEVVEDLEF